MFRVLPRHRENMFIFPDRDNMGNLQKYVFTEGIWLQYRQNVFKVRGHTRFVVGCCCNVLAFIGNFELGNILVIEWGYCIRFHSIFDCCSEGLRNSFIKNGLILYRKVKRLSLVLHLWYMENCAHAQSDDLDIITSNRMKYGIHNGRTLQ